MAKFEDFGLDKRMIRAIGEIGYATPTPIQEKCISLISKGSDCVAQSSTGSGKTAAFGLPILQKINRGGRLQFVVLTPTRELCLQVKDALVEFAIRGAWCWSRHVFSVACIQSGCRKIPQRHGSACGHSQVQGLG